MTTVTQLIRGTETVRDRAEPTTTGLTIRQSRYAAGTKTLMVPGEVISASKSSKRYSAVLVFQGIESETGRTTRFNLPFTVGGERRYIERPKASTHHVRVRCSCTDYTHTWAWWNNKHDALFGSKYPPYRRKTGDMPERNSAHKPGMCKHLLAVVKKLREAGILRA